MGRIVPVIFQHVLEKRRKPARVVAGQHVRLTAPSRSVCVATAVAASALGSQPFHFWLLRSVRGGLENGLP
jgi:hypothetical protein